MPIIMLLINLNIILYALQNLRGFLILKSETRSENLALIANNSIAFSLTPKEINTYNKFKNQANYTNVPFHFTNLKYKNEITEQTYKVFPHLNILPLNYSKFLTTILLIFAEPQISQIIGIQLKRKKTKFYIRLLGLLGTISRYQFLAQYAIFWTYFTKNKLPIFSYKKLIKLMFFRLQSGLFLEIKHLCNNLIFKAKIHKFFIKKTKKYYTKTLLKPKLTIIFKSNKLILN